MKTSDYIDQLRQKYHETRKKHWNMFVQTQDNWHGWRKFYHRRLEEVYGFLIDPGSGVLEIGCGCA